MDSIWERLLFLHFQPALTDGLLALAGVLLIIRILRIRAPSLRFPLLFIPLVRPLIILLDCDVSIRDAVSAGLVAGVRLPDLSSSLPDIIIHHEPGAYAEQSLLPGIPGLIASLTIVLLLVAAVWLLFRWAGFRIFLKRLRRQTVQISRREEERLAAMVRDISRGIGLKHPPHIMVVRSPNVYSCAIGWRKPVLVVNKDALRDLETAELCAIVAHEVSHFRRRDNIWKWISVLLRDMQLFSPFIPMIIKRMAIEREKACDNMAINAVKIPPRLLAVCLVKISKIMAAKKPRPLLGPGYSGFLGEKHCLLECRVKNLLEMDEAGGKPLTRAASMGKAKILALGAAWLLLTVVQFYIYIPVGDFILVLK